ncbi:MAG: tyrosine-type recombinase/integrase [Mesorhizobium sp.]
MAKIEKVKGLGLQYRQRKEGLVVYWTAPATSRFSPRTINLTKWIDFPNELERRAKEYNEQVRLHKAGIGNDRDFGKFSYVLRRYETDAGSPFHDVSPGSQRSYRTYMRRLYKDVGNVHLDSIVSTNIIRWFNDWSENRTKVSAGRMCLAVLNAIVTYGVSIRLEGCSALKEVIAATTGRLPTNKQRTEIFTTKQVVDVRASAHDFGRPSMALTYALVYETLLRLFDVHQHLDWKHINDDLILDYIPTKTAKKTGVKVRFDLNHAPMVMAELAPIFKNGKPKSGPVIVNEVTGVRYKSADFTRYFRKQANKIGLPKDLMARDLRASGITEARMYGGDITDLGKLAGHSTSTTTSVIYDRALLEAANRIAELRAKNRTF